MATVEGAGDHEFNGPYRRSNTLDRHGSIMWLHMNGEGRHLTNGGDGVGWQLADGWGNQHYTNEYTPLGHDGPAINGWGLGAYGTSPAPRITLSTGACAEGSAISAVTTPEAACRRSAFPISPGTAGADSRLRDAPARGQQRPGTEGPESRRGRAQARAAGTEGRTQSLTHSLLTPEQVRAARRGTAGAAGDVVRQANDQLRSMNRGHPIWSAVIARLEGSGGAGPLSPRRNPAHPVGRPEADTDHDDDAPAGLVGPYSRKPATMRQRQMRQHQHQHHQHHQTARPLPAVPDTSDMLEREKAAALEAWLTGVDQIKTDEVNAIEISKRRIIAEHAQALGAAETTMDQGIATADEAYATKLAKLEQHRQRQVAAAQQTFNQASARVAETRDKGLIDCDAAVSDVVTVHHEQIERVRDRQQEAARIAAFLDHAPVPELAAAAVPAAAVPAPSAQPAEGVGSECTICMDRGTDTAIVPCGHLFCAECATAAERP